MINKKRNFMKMFIIELEELKEELILAIKRGTKRHNQNEITNYVHWQNLAVLENEISKIESFNKDIINIDPDKYNNIDELRNSIIIIFEQHVNNKKINHSTIIKVHEKIEKIMNYIE